MGRTRAHGTAFGLLWAVGLAALTWGGLGLTGVHGTALDGTERATAVVDVVDTTPPSGLRVEGGPNADGWYAAPARYHWAAEDPESGIDSCQGGSVKPVDSSVPLTVYGTCVDGAGLSASYVGFSYRYDGTPPTLDPVAIPAVVPRHGVVVAVPRATDALSGVARQSCNGDRAPNTRRLGPHTITCFVLDRAGNLATASVSYLVVDRRLRQG